MSSSTHFDVIVIGGGASGMMAAGRAAARGRRVLLLEKNKELGKKLSVTGGGRCNILNAEPDTKQLLSHYGAASKFLHSAFAEHGMQDSWDFFHERGLPLTVQARKRAFPVSEHAPDVTRCLEQYLKVNQVQLRTGVKVRAINGADSTITGVETNKGVFTAERYILATGGASHPETGSTGDGFTWLQELGHTVAEPNPNIVPLQVAEPWVHRLSGTTLSFMKITFGTNRDKQSGRFHKVGKLLFTHFGLSGPLILNSAAGVKALLQSGPVLTSIDLYPDTDLGTLRRRVLAVFQANPNKQLKSVMKEVAPAGMGEAVLAQLPPAAATTQLNAFTREERDQIADVMKAMPLTITGTMGMDWAVVSDGGVALEEVDTRTMASKLYPNLYFTGDILHISRPSGGYSLQLCWTTGWVAGSHV